MRFNRFKFAVVFYLGLIAFHIVRGSNVPLLEELLNGVGLLMIGVTCALEFD